MRPGAGRHRRPLRQGLPGCRRPGCHACRDCSGSTQDAPTSELGVGALAGIA